MEPTKLEPTGVKLPLKASVRKDSPGAVSISLKANDTQGVVTGSLELTRR